MFHMSKRPADSPPMLLTTVKIIQHIRQWQVCVALAAPVAGQRLAVAWVLWTGKQYWSTQIWVLLCQPESTCRGFIPESTTQWGQGQYCCPLQWQDDWHVLYLVAYPEDWAWAHDVRACCQETCMKGYLGRHGVRQCKASPSASILRRDCCDARNTTIQTGLTLPTLIFNW